MTQWALRWGPRICIWELPLLLLLALGVFISIPIALGGTGLSSDALNHHIYLGWVADHSRFDRDLLAASYQSYQFPYLYWPLYKLAAGGASGVTAGVVLALVHLLAVPPTWLIARTCMPGQALFDVGMRFSAVILAFMTSAILLLFGTTSNDLNAAVPLIWSIAFAVAPLDSYRAPWMTRQRCIVLSGILAGVAIAVKLSNGPLVVLLPGLWWAIGRGHKERLGMVFVGCIGALAGLVATYGYWGWSLWTVFGNPIYPLYDPVFEVVRHWVGWQS